MQSFYRAFKKRRLQIKFQAQTGFQQSFIKFFCDHVKPSSLNALNCNYTNGYLSITQKRGLITLAPKTNKSANLLKNWKPITLFYCDFRITAKSFANRIKKVLRKIINSDQTDFLKNGIRKISVKISGSQKVSSSVDLLEQRTRNTTRVENNNMGLFVNRHYESTWFEVKDHGNQKYTSCVLQYTINQH